MSTLLPLRLTRRTSCEYMLVALRECAPPSVLHVGDTPERVHEYARRHLLAGPSYRPEVENFWVIWLNTRRRITGHVHVSCGTMDSLLIHSRDVFRAAIIANAAGVVLVHNHPSGEHQPSEADIKVTRDLIRAGQLLKIEVLDHLILGHPGESHPYSSLREGGYFLS